MIETWSTSALAIVAWLATYAIHSTILLLAAWLVTRRMADRPDLSSAVWKIAAVGGIVTASLSSGFAIESIGGRVAVPVAAAEAAPLRIVTVREGPIDTVAAVDESPMLPPVPLTLADETQEPLAPVAATAAPAEAPAWPIVVTAAWLLGLFAAALSLLAALLRLRPILRACRPAPAAMHEILANLCARVPSHRAPRLLASSDVIVPFATGVLAPVIVIPAAAASLLSPAAQRTMLAHELAHVLRRDPAWRVVLHVLERAFFFQPLLRLARRGLEHDAEYLCDAWAATQTDAPVELARCLTEIASWVRPQRPLALATPMSGSHSILRRRVLRLVAGPAKRRSSPRIVPLVGVIACGLLPFVAPVIAWAKPDPASPRVVVIRLDGERGNVALTEAADTAEVFAVIAARDRDAPRATAPESKASRKKTERKQKRERREIQRETSHDLHRVIRRAERDDRLPTAHELEAVLPAATPPARKSATRVVLVDDQIVAVVDADALVAGDDIASEIEAIIVQTHVIADAARANGRARGHGSARALEARAHALRLRAHAHRDAARALRARVRVVPPPHARGHGPPMFVAPPRPPAPPRAPRPHRGKAWGPDVVPAAPVL